MLGDLREDDEPADDVRAGPAGRAVPRSPTTARASRSSPTRCSELAASEPLASVAVLTPSRELSALSTPTASTQSEVPRLRQVAHQDFTFAPGVEVTEIEQVKGLEFDYVVLVEVSAAALPRHAASAPPAARRRDARGAPALADHRRPAVAAAAGFRTDPDGAPRVVTKRSSARDGKVTVPRRAAF